MAGPQQFYGTRRRVIEAVGLVAGSPVGTGLNVLRFQTGTIAGFNDAFTEATTAGDGTQITIGRRGVYGIVLIAEVPASGGAAFGISLNAPAAALQAADNPLPATAAFAGTLLAGAEAIAPLATNIPVSLEAYAPISDDDITNGRNVVRFHGNDGAAGGLAESDVVQTETFYRIVYLGDLKGA